MISFFLKAKHWQLFLLLFGIPFLFQFVFFVNVFSSIDMEVGPNPNEFFNFFSYFPMILILFVAIFFGWFWSMAIGLQHKIPATIKMNVKRFKFFFFVPLIYILLLSFLMSNFLNSSLTTMQESEVVSIIPYFTIIIPMHLFSMFCMFYMLYFVSKTIKTVELQRELRFSDFAGEFFLLWFYFIGIWIIQPKINKMVANDITI